MNNLLKNNLFMAGLMSSKEMPIYPEWVLAENLQECEGFFETWYSCEKKKTGRKKKEFFFVLPWKKPRVSKVQRAIND